MTTDDTPISPVILLEIRGLGTAGTHALIPSHEWSLDTRSCQRLITRFFAAFTTCGL
jgi:hypothetical protein